MKQTELIENYSYFDQWRNDRVAGWTKCQGPPVKVGNRPKRALNTGES